MRTHGERPRPSAAPGGTGARRENGNTERGRGRRGSCCRQGRAGGRRLWWEHHGLPRAESGGARRPRVAVPGGLRGVLREEWAAEARGGCRCGAAALPHVAAGPAAPAGCRGRQRRRRRGGSSGPAIPRWPRRPAEHVSLVSDVIGAYKCCGDPALWMSCKERLRKRGWGIIEGHLTARGCILVPGKDMRKEQETTSWSQKEKLRLDIREMMLMVTARPPNMLPRKAVQ